MNLESPETTVAAVDEFLEFVIAVFKRAEALGAFTGCADVLLTAGGSAFFDRVATKFGAVASALPLRIVQRGGCYVTYDHGMYYRRLQEIDARGGIEGQEGAIKAASDFTPALELFALVQSLQDPGVAIIGMGVRDMPHDAGFPIPLRQYREGELCADLWTQRESYKIMRSNDQHCYMQYPEGSDLQVGDMLAFGISHPCTAFDKWDVLYRVDEDFNITGALKTFF